MYGEIIRSFRISAGLTQEQMADALSVSRSLISKYESNATTPDIDMISEILELCDSNMATFGACLLLKEQDPRDARSTISNLRSQCAGYDTGEPRELSKSEKESLSSLRRMGLFTSRDLSFLSNFLTHRKR